MFLLNSDKHSFPAECTASPQVSWWKCGHLFHGRKSSVICVQTVSESSPEAARLPRRGYG